jgi:hypothetical protein
VIQMGRQQHVESCIRHLDGIFLFGNTVTIKPSPDVNMQNSDETYLLWDGSGSYADFTTCNLLRFVGPNAHKNREVAPSKVTAVKLNFLLPIIPQTQCIKIIFHSIGVAFLQHISGHLGDRHSCNASHGGFGATAQHQEMDATRRCNVFVLIFSEVCALQKLSQDEPLHSSILPSIRQKDGVRDNRVRQHARCTADVGAGESRFNPRYVTFHEPPPTPPPYIKTSHICVGTFRFDHFPFTCTILFFIISDRRQ